MDSKKNVIHVPPDKLIELVDKAALHKHMEEDLDEFSEFKHVTSVPKVGTTAYDIWLRGADRRRDEEHERAGSRMLQRAFNAVRHA